MEADALRLAGELASNNDLWAWLTLAFRFALAVAVLVGSARISWMTLGLLVRWTWERVFGWVKRWDVVLLRDQGQWKVTKIALRGVHLQGDKSDREKQIPLATWQSMEKTLVYQGVGQPRRRARVTA